MCNNNNVERNAPSIIRI